MRQGVTASSHASSHASGQMLDRLDWACRIADLSSVDLFITDTETARFLDCSRSAHERLGYSREDLLSMGAEQIQADPDHDADWVKQQLQLLREQGSGSFRTSHRCRDGSVLHVQVNHQVAEIDDRTVILSVVIDQTAQRSRELQLQQQLQLVSEGEAMHGFGSWRHLLLTDVMHWSDQMHRICGSDPSRFEPSFENYTGLIHPEDRSSWRRQYHLAIQRGEPMETRHRLLLPGGLVRTVSLSGQTECDDDGTPLRMCGTIADISASVELQLEARTARLTDPLTELPNKDASRQWLDRQLLGRPYNANIAIFSLDLDGFQEINDSFGSETGDRILQHFASALRNAVDQEAWVARLGSDEFGVIFSQGIQSFGDAINRARDLQMHLHELESYSEDLPIRLTVCIGISSYPEHGSDASQLLQSANTALMEAKHKGRGQIQAYSTTISRQIRDRLELDNELNRAICREQLRLRIQPQTNRDGQLIGGEVLVRWHDHRGRDVPPSFFIPLAEQSGLIFPLSDWVLATSLDQIARWRHQGLPIPRLAINISTRLLESVDRRLVSTLQEALQRHQLTPDHLELEITETALLQNPVAATEAVRMLAVEGFQIAIDDFGTGYSSLELLRNLPVHKLKIDQTFIRNLVNASADQAIVESTITLAHGLGMTCLAEGVETEAQRACLLALGCDQFQGYLCGHPQDVSSFAALLADPPVPCAGAAPELAAVVSVAANSTWGPSIPLNARSSSFEELTALRGAIDLSLDAYFLMQALYSPTGEVIDFTVLEANRTACEYLHQEREHVVGQMLCTLFPGVGRSGLLRSLGDCVLNSRHLEVNDFVYEQHEVYGDTRIYDLRAYPNANLLTLTWRDVTQRHRKVRQLADGAALLELLANNVTETLVLLDQQQRVAWVSTSLHAMTGWSVADWLRRPFSELFASGGDPPVPVDLDAWLPMAGEVSTRRLRMIDRSGGWSWMDVSARRLNDQTGPAAGSYSVLLSLRNADEQELRERRLQRLATVDQLTRLQNRRTILQRLEERIGAGHAHAEPLALLFIGCDGFKGINDRYGHAAGDAVLQAVAERIRRQVRHGDMAARLGGDEFLVVLDGIERPSDAMRVAETLVAAATEPIIWNQQSLAISLSIGVALHASGEDTELLLRRADKAMYDAKAGGRNRATLS